MWLAVCAALFPPKWDIVQPCPGGGPVIPNQSLAVQCLEWKIRTQKYTFFSPLDDERFNSEIPSCFLRISFHSVFLIFVLYWSFLAGVSWWLFMWYRQFVFLMRTHLKQNVHISNKAGVLNHISSFSRYKFRSFPEKLHNLGLNTKTSKMEKRSGKFQTD